MPYCPQCRAEYLEGVTACRKCGVPLVADLPEPAPAPSREIPARLRPLTVQFAAGWGYAVGAARLLWKRPGLLVLPVLVALFNIAEMKLGAELILRCTTTGRQMAAEARRWGPMERHVAFRQVSGDAGRAALQEFPSAVPGPELRGLLGLIWIAAFPREQSGLTLFLSRAVNAAAWLLLVVPLGAVFLSGYYGLLASAVTGVVAAHPFRQGVRQHFRRFVGYLALLVVVTNALRWGADYVFPSIIVDPVSATSLRVLFGLREAVEWLALALVLLLSLGLPAIVLEGMGTLRAAVLSIVTTVRQFPTLLALLALLFLVLLPVQWYAEAVSAHVGVPVGGWYFPGAGASGVALEVNHDLLVTLLGVWLALAQFLWYREAHPAPIPDAVAPTEG